MKHGQIEFRIMVTLEKNASATILVRSDTDDPPFIYWRTAAEYLLYAVAKKYIGFPVDDGPDLDMEEALCKLCQGAQQCSDEVIPNEILTLKRRIIEDEEPE